VIQFNYLNKAGGKMINETLLRKCLKNFRGRKPFDFCTVDGFFDTDVALKLSSEFPHYNSDDWFVYNNAIEHKKSCNNWNLFPETTYSVLAYLMSPKFVDMLRAALDLELVADIGLHGGGWHIHENGGNLNPHLDYSIHPKLNLERKLNLIIYLTPDFNASMGGELGLWEHNEIDDSPGKLIDTVTPLFNHAVLFDTTQNSWHGMVTPVSAPSSIYRQSLAVYYLCSPSADARANSRALFAPRDSQKGNSQVETLIKARSQT
jgi:hypothetical protein